MERYPIFSAKRRVRLLRAACSSGIAPAAFFAKDRLGIGATANEAWPAGEC
jgi:hypothetical protein